MAFSEILRILLNFLLNIGTKGLRISPEHGLENSTVVLIIYTNLPNLSCNSFPLLPNGPPSSS